MQATRQAVRVLLFNEKDELLFLRLLTSKEEHAKPFWLSPGGKIDGNETLRETAIRELYEETGIPESKLEIGPSVLEHEAELLYHDQTKYLYQHFVVAYTTASTISFENLTEKEKGYIDTYKWMSLEEINNHHEEIRPSVIFQYLPDILNKKLPKEPIIIPTRSYLC